MGRQHLLQACPISMLKKSIHGFFNYVLAEWDSAKPHKFLDFSTLAIGQSIHGLLSSVFFNILLVLASCLPSPPSISRPLHVRPARIYPPHPPHLSHPPNP